MLKKFNIHIEEDEKSRPRPHELMIAEIMADYFKSDIVFLRRLYSKTPDLYILKTNIKWEIKSPTGAGKHTIQTNLRNASKQSENIILDLHRSDLTKEQAVSRVKDFVQKEHSRIKRLKIITKRNQIIDIIGK